MLELKEVRVATGDGRLSEAVSVTIGGGDVCCIGGDSAALTRLAGAVVGMAAVAEGFVTIDGEPLTAASGSVFRHSMAYIPHDVRLPEMTVGAFVAGLNRLHLNRKVKVERSMLLAEWERLLPDAPPDGADLRTLSGSQVRRIMLSTVTFFMRPYLIADQLTDGMTADEERLTAAYLRGLAEKGTGILLTARPDDTLLNQAEHEHYFIRSLSGAAAPAGPGLHGETL